MSDSGPQGPLVFVCPSHFCFIFSCLLRLVLNIVWHFLSVSFSSNIISCHSRYYVLVLPIRLSFHPSVVCMSFRPVFLDLPLLDCLRLQDPSMFTVKAKIYGVTIINPALLFLMKHLIIGQRQKAPNFSAFHWSPHGSLVSIGQHSVITRVVQLPKRAKTSLITESDRSGPNHRIGSGCVGRAQLHCLRRIMTLVIVQKRIWLLVKLVFGTLTEIS